MDLGKKICILIFGIYFLLGSANAQQKLTDFFYDFEIINLDTDNLLAKIEKSNAENISIDILGFEMQLAKSKIISDHYLCTVLDISGVSDQKRKPTAVPLNGYTSKGGRVSITIGNDFVQGFIRTAMYTFYIEPVYHFEKDAPKGQYVMYNVKDIRPGREMDCGVTEAHRIKNDNIRSQDRGNRMGACYELEYALAADYLMFDHYGSVAAVEAHNVAVTNDMQTNYDDEFADEIQFVIVQQFIVTTPGGNPWSPSTAPLTLLESFTNWGQAGGFSVTYDLASLWTKRDLDGSTIGLAWVDAVCTPFRYNILEDFGNNANLKRVLLAHEIGHNFNAVHDASNSPHIMAPAVQNTNTWSAASITAIQNHYLSRTCLGGCTPSEPFVNFLETDITIGELGGTTGSLYCGSPYKTLSIPVRLNRATNAPSVFNVTVLPSSTATQGRDFQLTTPTLTFPAGTANTQQVILHIIDDAIDETAENLILELTHVSGPAQVGTANQSNISILDDIDRVTNNCCSPGGFIQYGNFNFTIGMIFLSFWEDGRTRFLYLPSQLAAAGLSAGWITGISVFVNTKNSIYPFQNFRVGMKNVGFNTLEGQEWEQTNEVYTGTYTTTNDAWNLIQFQSPFYWDGTSSIYFEICFDNDEYSPGNDVIRGTSPVGGGTGKYHEWMQIDDESGCTMQTTIFSASPPFQNIQPQLRFYGFGGALIENTLNKNSKTSIAVGETAHFYSDQRRVIASVKNLGNTDLECIEVSVATTGNGKIALPFGGGDYTQKTIRVEADENSLYEITLYYTNTQMTTWGTNAGRLNIIKSDTPLATSTLGGVEIIRPDSIFTGLGPDNAYGYKATFSGFSWFALTDRKVEIGADIVNGDLVLTEASAGLIFNNKSGAIYKTSVQNGGTLVVNNANTAEFEAALQDKDLKVNAAGAGVIFRAPNNSLWRMAVSNTGNITVTSVGSLPAVRTDNQTGNFAIQEPGGALILRSPNNQCWRLYINENGQLRSVNVICP